MNEKLAGLWAKVVENREIAIRIGCAAAGALLGGVVTAVILNAQHESMLLEETTFETVDE